MAQRNASRPGAVKSAGRRAQKVQARSAEALRWVMSEPLGRLFVWELLEKTGALSNPYSSSAQQTFFNCGMLSVGQDLFGRVFGTAPEQYMVMAAEAQKRAADDETIEQLGDEGETDD